jgi:hypothetical protein
MKILFLDIDGVLNSWRWYKSLALKGRQPSMMPDDQIDPKAVTRLNKVIERTGAKVVVSSTWRLMRTVTELQQVLNRFGFVGEVVGKTPRLHRDGDGNQLYRGHEIQQWLDENPGVELFAIVDDDSDMAHLMDRLVRTDMKKGLTPVHVEQLVTMLSPP